MTVSKHCAVTNHRHSLVVTSRTETAAGEKYSRYPGNVSSGTSGTSSVPLTPPSGRDEQKQCLTHINTLMNYRSRNYATKEIMVIIIKSNLRIRKLHGNFVSCVHTADKQTLLTTPAKYRCWSLLTPKKTCVMSWIFTQLFQFVLIRCCN